MEKIVEIDGKRVGFRANALTPRLYRIKNRRDIVQDLNQLRRSFQKAQRAVSIPVPGADATENEKQEYEDAMQDAQLSVLDLTIFEDVAFVMARQYDPEIPNTVEEWLEDFETFSVYKILPEILDLWAMNQETTAVPKKK